MGVNNDLQGGGNGGQWGGVGGQIYSENKKREYYLSSKNMISLYIDTISTHVSMLSVAGTSQISTFTNNLVNISVSMFITLSQKHVLVCSL